MTDEPAPTIATLRDSLRNRHRPPSARAQRREIAMMDASPTRWSELLAPEYAISTTTLCLGVSLFAFNGFLVSTSLPTAVEELGGAALISWSLTVYLVFAIVGGSGAAVIKQRFGGRTALLGAALIFLAGSLLAGFAPTMAQVLIGRALQGAGEGIVAAICYALIPELFPSRLVSKVFGAEAMVWAVAAFGGPLAAGVLTESLSWRAAFLVNVPLSLIFIVLVATVVPETARQSASSGVPGLRLGAIGLGIFLICWAGVVVEPALAIAMLAVAVGLLAGAIRLDRRAEAPLLPDKAFSPRAVIGAGLWVVVLMPMAQTATSVFLVLALQSLWGFTPTAAGAISALMALCWSLSAIGIANIHGAAMRSKLIVIGPGLLVAGLLAALVALQIGNLALLILGQIAIGAAFGFTWGPLSQLLMEASPAARRDHTSAFLPTLQSAGYAIGAAVLGLAANLSGLARSSDGDSLRQAMLVVFVLGTMLAIAGFLAALRLLCLVRTTR